QWALDQKGTVKTRAGATLADVPNLPFSVENIVFPQVAGPMSGAASLLGLRGIKTHHWTNLKNADGETDSIAKLDSLLSLWITQSDLSGAGLQRLTTLRQISDLRLPNNGRLTDVSLAQLSSFEHLQVAECERSQIGNRGLSALARLSSLENLG